MAKKYITFYKDLITDYIIIIFLIASYRYYRYNAAI